MQITFVKKIKADGNPCRKCSDVERRLNEAGLMHHIDHVVIADEQDPDSEGMRLAQLHQVEAAPFFLVEEDQQPPRVYTVYFRFLREVLERSPGP